jgi:hypothetical protein
MPLTFSKSESNRFDLSVFRNNAFRETELETVLPEAIEESADLVILRFETIDFDRIYTYLSNRCHCIPADSLIEFRKRLNASTIADRLGSGATISEYNGNDRDSLSDVIERCYEAYTNHYHANPCLNVSGVLAGLVEFSRGFTGNPNRTIFVARRDGRLCGYLCMDISAGIGSTVIGGSALDFPAAARHKILCDLTHAGDLWLMDRGVKEFKAVTRIDKIYIQKLLINNMHCMPSRSLSTIHLNLFLQKIAAASAADNAEIKPNRVAQLIRTGTYQLRDPLGETREAIFSFSSQGARYTFGNTTDSTGTCRIDYSLSAE